MSSGHSFEDILLAYPYLEEEDLREALKYDELQKKDDLEKKRPFGLSKGKFVVPEDFDAPLPEEILDVFEQG